jgi:hypothetical protein
VFKQEVYDVRQNKAQGKTKKERKENQENETKEYE